MCGVIGSRRAEPQVSIAAIRVEGITTGRAQLPLGHRAESQVGGTAERQVQEKVCHALSD